MKTSLLAIALGTISLVQAGALSSWPVNATGGITYETITTTALTTYCPEATVLTHGGLTYTITEATTLTITDCPCTITRPMQTLIPTTLLYTSCPPTNTASPNNNHPNQNNNSPAQTAVYTQTVTDKNGAQATVTGTGTVGQKNGGVAAPTGGSGGGGNNNGTYFTGGGAARGVKEGVVLMGLAGLIVFVL